MFLKRRNFIYCVVFFLCLGNIYLWNELSISHLENIYYPANRVVRGYSLWARNIEKLRQYIKTDDELAEFVVNELEKFGPKGKKVALESIIEYLEKLIATPNLGSYLTEESDISQHVAITDIIQDSILYIIDILNDGNKFKLVMESEGKFIGNKEITLFPITEGPIEILDKASENIDEFKAGLDVLENSVLETKRFSQLVNIIGLDASQKYIKNIKDFKQNLEFLNQLVKNADEDNIGVIEVLFEKGLKLVKKVSDNFEEFQDSAKSLKNFLINCDKNNIPASFVIDWMCNKDEKNPETIMLSSIIGPDTKNSLIGSVSSEEFNTILKFANKVIEEKITGPNPDYLIEYFFKSLNEKLENYINSSVSLDTFLSDNFNQPLLSLLFKDLKSASKNLDKDEFDDLINTSNVLTKLDNLVDINSIIEREIKISKLITDEKLFKGVKNAAWFSLFEKLNSINSVSNEELDNIYEGERLETVNKFKQILHNITSDADINEKGSKILEKFIKSIVKLTTSQVITNEQKDSELVSIGGKLNPEIVYNSKRGRLSELISETFGISAVNYGLYGSHGDLEYRLPALHSVENLNTIINGLQNMHLLDENKPTRFQLTLEGRMMDDIKYAGWLLLGFMPEIKYKITQNKETLLGITSLSVHGGGVLQVKPGEDYPEGKARYNRTDFLFLGTYNNLPKLMSYAQVLSTLYQKKPEKYKHFKYEMIDLFGKFKLDKEEIIEYVKETYKNGDRSSLLTSFKDLPEKVNLNSIFKAPWFKDEAWTHKHYGERFETDWRSQYPYAVILEAFKHHYEDMLTDAIYNNIISQFLTE